MSEKFGAIHVDNFVCTSGTDEVVVKVSGLTTIARSGITITGDYVGDNITASGDLTVSGAANISGLLSASGATINNNLNVSGVYVQNNATISGDVFISGDLTVTGTITGTVETAENLFALPNSSNLDRFPVFSTVTSGTSLPYTDADFKYNPSQNRLTVQNLVITNSGNFGNNGIVSSGNIICNGDYTGAGFQVTNGGKIQDVTGDYGSVKVTGGATGGYSGYAIDASAVFMDNGTNFGLYDDTNNHWALRHTKNGATNLYYDGDVKLATSSAGGTLTGTWTGTVTNATNAVNADTVDSLHASSFLRSDASDEYEGQVSGRILRVRCVDGRLANSISGSLFPLEVFQNTSNADAAIAFHVASDYAAYFGLDGTTNDLFWGGWSRGAVKYKIWHAGNDGSGSGLDADTVDGIQGASFLRSDATDTATGTLTLNGDVNIRSALDFADGDVLRMGSSDDWTVTYNSNGWNYINQKQNGIIFQDNGTAIMRLEDSGVFRPEANYGGSIGTSTVRWSIGYFRYVRGQSSGNPGHNNSTTGYAMTNDGAGYFSISSGTALYTNRNNNGGIVRFGRAGVENGQVVMNTNSVSYATTSDYRLKENTVALENGIERVKQLKPYRFNFIRDPDETLDGFFAHEAQEVVPECASGTKDEMEDIGTLTEWDGTVIETDTPQPEELTWEETTTDEDGNETTQTRTRTWKKTGEKPVYQGIDQAKLVPLLTAALQEAIAKIETLETKVAALEAN